MSLHTDKQMTALKNNLGHLGGDVGVIMLLLCNYKVHIRTSLARSSLAEPDHSWVLVGSGSVRLGKGKKKTLGTVTKNIQYITNRYSV